MNWQISLQLALRKLSISVLNYESGMRSLPEERTSPHGMFNSVLNVQLITFSPRTTNELRVLDTATYFMRGYLSAGNYLSDPSLNRGHLIVLANGLTAEQSANATNGSFADSLTPSTSCPPYALFSNNGSSTSNTFSGTFQNQTAARINALLRGNLSFNATDIGVMQDLCGFGFEISGDRRFCEVFTGNILHCLHKLSVIYFDMYQMKNGLITNTPTVSDYTCPALLLSQPKIF
jgi:hypothetical protein